jgi:hypothetical protein
VLEATTVGKNFLKKTDRTTSLDAETRSILIKLINADCAAKASVMGIEQIRDVVTQIIEIFPLESADVYFKHVNGKASGALYTAHNNMLKKLRAEKLIEPSRKRKREATDRQNAQVDNFSQEEHSSNDFVQKSAANINTDILKDHWVKSSRVRLDTFRKQKDECITKQYRALQRPDAYILVSKIDLMIIK